MNKILLALLFFCFHALSAENDELKIFESQKDIGKITNSIKLKQATLKDKFDYYGIQPTSASVHKITKNDAIEDPRLNVGDIEYSVNFPPDKLNSLCNSLGSADFLYRKHNFIPETKTANWLATGKCELPEDIK